MKIIKKTEIMIKLFTLFMVVVTLASCEDATLKTYPPPEIEQVSASFYLTTPDKLNLLTKQESNIFPIRNNTDFTINVSENETYQSMDGFGFTLTGGSAMHINAMSSSAKNELLQELFSVENGIGVSYLRISIGASDLDSNVFSYNDLPPGQTDTNQTNFSISADNSNLIPVLKDIVAINPSIKILATPWSAPSWMKTNGSSIGGKLQNQYYTSYATYFVKYIEAMQNEGIAIEAITVQNEPENPYNNPSMLMEANEQKDFISNHLGPLFITEGITTKIILFDHNLDNPNYPISILNDNNIKQYVSGSAFHLYAGTIDNMSFVKNAHPDKDVYFTEQWVQAPGDFPADIRWHVRELIIGASRNWSKTILEWNLAADPENKPFTNGGCTECLGALTIDGNNVTKNSAFYIIAHASKYVPQGSIRIKSNTSLELPNVAFLTPEDKIVVIVLNNTDIQKSFNINVTQEPISMTLSAGSVATLVW
ncbi:glycoside hydrolase family 30 beta sandwich domain-containing protein [Polaribacter sp. Hel1_33_78]|jgi:glucosylceramidase|uniref:glycoside hydrolase family 30 protein n=1 Tax=Polaribacter sp. Hel1_33_78 TaxID=1336804 RepID=UPI0018D3270E|nr:glycoside hydrolase family 30 beta sandwich domain-containing protein [Polaribacter sp. Hel1_33_78]